MKVSEELGAHEWRAASPDFSHLAKMGLHVGFFAVGEPARTA
jgi:hypothetical protein